jgi:hypothetical protein
MESDGEVLRRRYGPEAVAAAEDIAHFLEERFEEESVHASLWASFEADPEANSAEVIGVLEAWVEADPALARRLNAFTREYHAVMVDDTASVETDSMTGGVTGGVQEGDALNTAVDPGAVPGEQERPYRPVTSGPSEITAPEDAAPGDEQGTYLYGNVQRGAASLEQSIGVDTFDFGERIRAVDLANLSGLPALLDAVSSAVEDHPTINVEQQRQVQATLNVLREEFASQGAVEADRLVQSLVDLRDAAPEVAEVLTRALAAMDLHPAAQKALDRFRSLPPASS